MIDEEALRSIEKLHEMKQAGIISETDFEKAKQDLLQGRPKPKARGASAIFSDEIQPYPELPADKDLGGWLIYPLRRYAIFTGRSCRKEFWIFQAIIAVLVIILLSALEGAAEAADLLAVALCSLTLAGLAVPAIALQIRRFHDQDQTGWFALLNFVPYVGPLIIAGFMLVDGTPGDNQYGPDPKGRE